MFLRETIETCPTCDEVTPHSRRKPVCAWVVGSVVILSSGVVALLGRYAPLLAGLLWAFLLYFVLRYRQSGQQIACVRCRTKSRVSSRRNRPKLDGSTEISLF